MTMRLPALALPIAAIALAAAVSLHAQPAPAPAGDGTLPDAPGRATVMKVCSGCHEPNVVATQRHSEKDWHDVVELMAGNGAQGTDAEFAEITAYLAKNFPAAE